MATLLARRDIASTVATTRSSWDQCMTKAYCKWPVIAAIIVVSIVVFSVVWCLVRCICCGAECCCSCLSCCNSCCPSGRRKGGHQPLASAPPKSHDGHAAAQYKSHSPPIYRGPQTATFDSPSKPVNEDALPAMPTWEQAGKKKVETIEMDDVEMEKLDAQPQDPRSASAPMLANAACAPMWSPHSPPRSLRSPPQRSPYDPPARSPFRLPANEGYGYAPPQQAPFLGGALPSPGSYHSGQETGVAGSSDQRQHGTVSPAPYPGYNNMPYGDDQYTAYSGTTYAPSRSTRHEPSMNDPYQQSRGQAQSPQGWQDQRLGRKPVQGSWRDI